MNPDDRVTELKGIGPKKAEALERIGIETLEDMMLFIPRDYEDRRNTVRICDISEDKNTVVRAKVVMTVKDRYRYGRKQLLRLLVSDDTGMLEVVFFNARYIQDKFKKGKEYTFFGRIVNNFGKLQMIHPEFSDENDTEAGILPVYSLTKGITQKEMRSWQKSLKGIYGKVEDFLNPEMLERERLCSMEYALSNIHFPSERKKYTEAKYRIIFNELFVFQAGIYAARKNARNGKRGIAFSHDADISEYINTMPYILTGAQKRCISEIEADLVSDRVMNRLVQGDVGSGKTAVAEIAMYKAVKSGYQSVLMAPTEILARQHYDSISKAFKNHGIKVVFLSGSMKSAEKKSVLDKIKNGKAEIVIGTHAVIQPEVEFARLGLVITDEQHRFGVRQRIKLKEKGNNPNILVMTATPIPRTLSVVLYADLDVSIIDEMPPGRKPVRTKCIAADKRDECYSFVRKQLDEGHQAYVVTPLIEDSEAIDVRSAHNVYEELSSRFSRYNVSLIHGAMKQDEKEQIMDDFYNGDIDILVATVVIEVGINVPNATVMIVENSERFGLAQLHQLRGRVGRGSSKSFCFLINESDSQISAKRGEIMEKSNDGFFIAEEDLKLRGPGDIFGTRQHGIPDFDISYISKHMKILEHAKKEAVKIIDEDPMLKNERNCELKKRIIKLFGNDIMLIL